MQNFNKTRQMDQNKTKVERVQHGCFLKSPFFVVDKAVEFFQKSIVAIRLLYFLPIFADGWLNSDFSVQLCSKLNNGAFFFSPVQNIIFEQ